jgi:hypothetical protein
VLRSKRVSLTLTFAIALIALFVTDSLKTLLLSPLVDMLSKCR